MKIFNYLLCVIVICESPHFRSQNPDKDPVAYPPLREADVMWSKRLWRIIDLREKINLPLYYPLQQHDNFKALFEVLYDAIKEGKLTPYGNPAFDDSFKNALTRSEVDAALVKYDSAHIGMNALGEEEVQPLRTEITAENIKQYLVKEDWYFDKQRSKLEVRIVGICPMVESFSESGEFRGYKPLFWIYFPEARTVLSHHPAFNSRNPGASMTFDDLFIKRMFNSMIIKESNVYDRFIADYKQGIDALLESQKIEEELFAWEDGVWHY